MRSARLAGMLEFDAAAQKVRTLLNEASGLIAAGNPAWQKRYNRAVRVAQKCTTDASREDAGMRIALFTHQLDLNEGNATAALQRMNEAFAAIERQGRRGDDPARNTDHRWAAHIARCRVHQILEDLDSAAADAEAALALASGTLDPEGRLGESYGTLAAVEQLRGNYARAVEHSTEAVKILRTKPESFGPALLGLAQAQAMLGQLDVADRTLARVEALDAGSDNVDFQAKVLQLRAYLANATLWRRGMTGEGANEDLAAAHDQYAEHVQQHADVLEQAHRGGASASVGAAQHAQQDLFAARKSLQKAVKQAAKAGDAVGHATALVSLATVQQDIALKYGHPDQHTSALAQLALAQQAVAHAGRPIFIAAIDIDFARYVLQWHDFRDYSAHDVLREAFGRAARSSVYLHTRSFDGSLAAERREYAAQHAAHAFDLAFEIAFGLGDTTKVAELIELRASGAEFYVSDQDAPLGASVAPPLVFAPEHPVLEQAFADAQTAYGLPKDYRQPIATW